VSPPHCVSPQDLLPHLPNFTEMELFQEDICQTLQHCGDNIQLLKNQMRELADTAETTMQVWVLLSNARCSSAHVLMTLGCSG
jgi:hypothetical protein